MPWRSRPAYRFTAEDSIYLRPAVHRRGIGRLLLRRGMEAVVGDSANAASIRLHGALGFRRVGALERVGFKFGRWVDTVLLQRELDDRR